MPKKIKTLKQKIRADEKKAQNQSLVYTFDSQKTVSSFSQTNHMKQASLAIATDEYQYVRKDLQKTIFVTLFIMIIAIAARFLM